MKTCIAIRHVQFEHLGSFEKPIQEAGYTVKYLEASRDSLDCAQESDLTVFLGGPMGVYEEHHYPFLRDVFWSSKSRHLIFTKSTHAPRLYST